MGIVVILFLIFILYAYNVSNSIKKLENENKKLKKELEKYKKMEKINTQDSNNNLDVKTLTDVEHIISEKRKEILNETSVKSSKKEFEVHSKEKIEKLRKEKQNTSILISGAILIVFAAIVFLMSTWNAISNIIKIALVLLFTVFFLGMSKIAKTKFKLEKTSNTFFYIAMAYIPICLISCSLFGLVGEYFSINGDGRFIYFTVVSIIISIIYYFYYTKRKSDILFIGMLLSQTLAVILFGLIFERNLLVVTLGLLIYNLILILLKNRLEKIDLLKYFYNIIPYISFVISLFFINSAHILMLFVILLLAINFFLLSKVKNNSLTELYFFNIAIYFLGIYFSYTFLKLIPISLKQILSVIYIIFIFVIQEKLTNFKKTNLQLHIASVFLGMICIQSIELENIVILKPFMLLLIEMLLLIVGIMKSEKLEKSIYTCISLICFILAGSNIITLLNLNYTFYILFAILTFVISEIINYTKIDRSRGLFIIPHIFIIGITLISLLDVGIKLFDNIIIFLLLDITYIYSFIKYKENQIFKYLSYILIGFTLLSITRFLGLKYNLVPMILTILISLIEQKYRKVKDNFSVGIFSIIAYTSLVDYNEPINSLLAFLFSAYLIFYNIKNEENKYLRCIPVIGLLVILNTSIKPVYESYVILLTILSTIALTVVSTYKRKVSLDTVFSGLYLLYTFYILDNEIISEMFLIFWAFINMFFMEEDKSKDIFKSMAFFGILLFYESFISEIELEYQAFYMIGITIFIISMFKNILKKYVKEIENIEYLVYGILYFLALANYNNEKDGMIYVAFMVGVLIYSYIQKYGTLFIITLAGILINAVALTRTFWFSIPWWVYLLIIGGILIGFAIKNENDDNKNKVSMGNVVKNLKDKIEK